jgi:uncharacterized C2H2 Zn-finger protein
MVELTCPICEVVFKRKPYEVKRNEAKGRVNLCGRSCQATWMNLSEAKQAQTKAILAARNSHQYREDNPNWKGGISNKLKPIPQIRCPQCDGVAACEGPVSMEKDYYCPDCDHHFSEEDTNAGG